MTQSVTLCNTMCDIDDPRQNLQEECFVDLNEPQRTFQSTVVNRWLLLGLVLAAKMSNSWLVTLAGLAQSRLEATGVVADFQGAVQGFLVPQERACR